MTRYSKGTAARLRLLRDDVAGTSITEFALALPLVVGIALTGLEYANLAMAHLRVSQIADTVADNAGRVPEEMNESDIAEIFTGATNAGSMLNFATHGRIVLSSLQENGQAAPATAGDPDNRGQTIRWQRCTGALAIPSDYGVEGKGKTDNSLQTMGKAPRTIAALPLSAVMFVEVTYDYQPIISNKLVGHTRIRYESAFTVRDRANLGITNVPAIPVNSC